VKRRRRRWRSCRRTRTCSQSSCAARARLLRRVRSQSRRRRRLGSARFPTGGAMLEADFAFNSWPFGTARSDDRGHSRLLHRRRGRIVQSRHFGAPPSTSGLPLGERTSRRSGTVRRPVHEERRDDNDIGKRPPVGLTLNRSGRVFSGSGVHLTVCRAARLAVATSQAALIEEDLLRDWRTSSSHSQSFASSEMSRESPPGQCGARAHAAQEEWQSVCPNEGVPSFT